MLPEYPTPPHFPQSLTHVVGASLAGEGVGETANDVGADVVVVPTGVMLEEDVVGGAVVGGGVELDVLVALLKHSQMASLESILCPHDKLLSTKHESSCSSQAPVQVLPIDMQYAAQFLHTLVNIRTPCAQLINFAHLLRST